MSIIKRLMVKLTYKNRNIFGRRVVERLHSSISSSAPSRNGRTGAIAGISIRGALGSLGSLVDRLQ
ncbi:hypothetical protein AOG23_24055 [Rhizobium acidisoli]|nr:hypothetical protein AOG23_24055 [Rhizobium acidisoli]